MHAVDICTLQMFSSLKAMLMMQCFKTVIMQGKKFNLILLMVAPVQSSSERENYFMDFQWIYKGKVQLCQTEGTHAKETRAW